MFNTKAFLFIDKDRNIQSLIAMNKVDNIVGEDGWIYLSTSNGSLISFNDSHGNDVDSISQLIHGESRIVKLYVESLTVKQLSIER